MMPRPATLVAAITILLVGVAISIPFAYLNVASIPTEDAAINVSGMLTGYFMAVSFQIIFIYLIFSGRNWSRYVYVVLLAGGIMIRFDGPDPEMIFHQGVVLNHWIQMAISLVVVVLLLLPPTTAWFKEMKILKHSKEPE